MQAIAINLAEAIIEPFWDPDLSELADWKLEENPRTGTRVWQNWCNVMLEWQDSQQGEKLLRVSRRYREPVDIRQYDTLLLSVLMSNGCTVRITAETDRGSCSMTSAPFGQGKEELALPLEGGKELYALQIELYGNQSSSGIGWFNWIGLQDSGRIAADRARYQNIDPKWEGSLYPKDTPVSFSPQYGIFFSKQQLEQMRAFYQKKRAEGIPSPFAPDSSYEKYWYPEQSINDFVNFWDDTRYCRQRDEHNYLIRNGLRAALYGVLEKDAESLHLAARYAMSILACDHWDDGMICDFPKGSWEHRCFVQSLCLYDLVFIYDLAAEYFTPVAKSRLFRRMAEEGLSSINYTTWKHEYIFHCNQMVWFSHGRMAAYSLLKKEWPRVAKYMEIAYEDVVENIQNTVLPDGGYVEGPTYFTCIGNNGGQALYLYSRAVGKEIEEVLPSNLWASAQFADALLSTDREQDMFPICDGRPLMPQSHLAFMAFLLKDSKWVDLFQKSVNRSGGLADDYFALMVQSMDLPSKAKTRPFVLMPEMQLAASHRLFQGKDVKMIVLGNRSGAGHTHEDKGSFILEYAGETFAMDLGTCDYSSPYSFVYKQCQRHNGLVPDGSSRRVSAENPCMRDVAVEGRGDEHSFQVSLSPGIAYPDYYQVWDRTIVSEAPNRFSVTDTYCIKEDCGCCRVEFLWNTMLPVEQRENQVFVMGRDGQAVIKIPEGCRCELRRLEIFQNQFQNQIALIKDELSSSMTVQFELI